MDFLEFIKKNLEKTSIISMDNFGKVSSSIKGNDANAVLTKTDLEIGKFIVNNIKKTYPHHNIIDEETGVINNNSNYTWIIDPIDGTSNFAAGLPFFGTQLALLENNIPIVGGISLPYFKEIYLSEKNRGTFCNGSKISITSKKDLISILLSYGVDSHRDDIEFTNNEMKILGRLINKVQNLRSTNSCYDGMMVAKGKIGAYLNQSMRIWDIVPLQIVIEESGGLVTDFYGNNLVYENHLLRVKEHFTLCAASPVLHQQLQVIIHNVK